MRTQRAMPQTIEGRILIVQEDRVRLKTDDGGVLLLSLPHGCRWTMSELQRLHRENARVAVEYEGEPNTEEAALRSLRVLAAGRG